MAEFKHPSLNLKFSLPDKITIRQQIAYWSIFGDAFGETSYMRYWMAMLPIIENWECAFIDDPQEIDMDSETDPRIAQAIVWCANKSLEHMQGLGNIPKNE